MRRPETLPGGYYAEIRRKLSGLDRGEDICRVHVNPRFGNIDWPLEEGLCLEIVFAAERFYNEILDFVRGFPLEEPLLTELWSYQYHAVRKPESTGAQKDYSYDFLHYFRAQDLGGSAPLQRRKNRLTYKNLVSADSPAKFATRVVWYGRKSARVLFGEQEIPQSFPEE